MMFVQSGLGMARCSRSPILLASSFTCHCLVEQGIHVSCVELTSNYRGFDPRVGTCPDSLEPPSPLAEASND